MQPFFPPPAASVAFALLMILAAVAPSAGAVTVLQTDDFQDESQNGWAHGPPSPFPPEVNLDVGPGGSGDHSLYVASFGGGGAGGRWITFNRSSRWTGDYAAAGVQALQLDVFNFSGIGLTFRVALIGPGGSFVTDGVFVEDTNQWESISFSLAPGDLVPVAGSNVNLTLSAVNEIRILENASPDVLGDVVVADVYLDNITTLPGIPEPSRALLSTLALTAVLAGRRRVR